MPKSGQEISLPNPMLPQDPGLVKKCAFHTVTANCSPDLAGQCPTAATLQFLLVPGA